MLLQSIIFNGWTHIPINSTTRIKIYDLSLSSPQKYWRLDKLWSINPSLQPCTISHTNNPTIRAYKQKILIQILNWYYCNLCYENWKDVCNSYIGQIENRDMTLEGNFSVSLNSSLLIHNVLIFSIFFYCNVMIFKEKCLLFGRKLQVNCLFFSDENLFVLIL